MGVVLIKKKLEQLKKLAIEQDPSTAGLFVPGPSEAEVVEKLSRLPFTISPDAVDWFTWMDMPQEVFFKKQIELLPGAYFIGVDQALAEFEELYPLQDELEDVFQQQYRNQFRFLSDLSDSGYGFGSLEAPCNGRIIHLTIHEEWHLAFENLERLIDTAIACHYEGIYSDSDIPDIYRYYQLARRMNPGMDAWLQG